jgi:hypothetical protein
MAQIHELLPKVMKDIGSIGKDQTNKHQSYKFRGIDDALNHAGPILTKHLVSVSVEFDDHKIDRKVVRILDDKGREKERVESYATLGMKLTFHAPDGSTIANRLVGEGQDYGGDKATNKAMAAAFKYGIFFGLIIPVAAEAIDDSDRDKKEDDRPAQRPTTKPAANQDDILEAQFQARQSDKGLPQPAPRKPASTNDDILGDELTPASDIRWKCRNPTCGKSAVIKDKERGDFVCWKKEGGCGVRYPAKGGKPLVKEEAAKPDPPTSAVLTDVLAKVGCMTDEDSDAVIAFVCKEMSDPPIHTLKFVLSAEDSTIRGVAHMIESDAKKYGWDKLLGKAVHTVDSELF